MKVSEAAKSFGVPKSSLHDHITGKYAVIGAAGPTTLTSKDEQENTSTR